MEATKFNWPKALRALIAETEEQDHQLIEPIKREMYPIETKALVDLVAGVPLSTTIRQVAPGMGVKVQRENKGQSGYAAERNVYLFAYRSGTRVLQMTLYTGWAYDIALGGDPRELELRQENIVLALCRILERTGEPQS